MRLTVKAIEAFRLPAGKTQEIVRFAEIRGLAMRFGRRGGVWVWHPKAGGRITLGDYGTALTIEQAIARVHELAAAEARGDDPTQLVRRRGQPEGPEELTVSTAWELYKAAGSTKKNGSSKAASTIKADGLRFDKHIKPRLGKRLVTELQDADLRKLERDIAAQAVRTKSAHAGGRGQSGKCVLLVCALVRWCEREDLVPVSTLGRTVPTRQSRKMQTFLTHAELVRLATVLEEIGRKTKRVDVCSTAAAARLLMATGMRAGEAFRLTWSEVDLDRGFINLRHAKSQGDDGRHVALNADAVAVLEAQRGADPVHVFPGKKAGKAITSIKKTFATALERAGIERVRVHDLRHSFAAELAGANVSLHRIGKVLGHKTVSTTSRYAHLAPDSLADAAAQFDLNRPALKVVDGGRS